MPSRRALLSAGGLAASVALTGCSTVTGPPGVAAMLRGDVLDVPEAESAPIVARAEAASDDRGCPEGKVDVEARVHEVRRADDRTELALVTEYDLITGESGCSTGWGQAGIAVGHDWRTGGLSDDGSVETRQSNVVPTSDEHRKQATLERDHSEAAAGWRVHLIPPTKSTMTYHFASTFAGPGTLAEGDVLVETRADAQVRRGWLGGDAVLETETTLTYGDTER